MPNALHIQRVTLGDGNPDEDYRIKQAAINVATVASHTIVAAVPGRKIRVVNLHYRAFGTVTITWQTAAAALGGPGIISTVYLSPFRGMWGPL